MFTKLTQYWCVTTFYKKGFLNVYNGPFTHLTATRINMKGHVVTASEIGKTAYCPHAHYLSTKHANDKATRKRLAHGNKMHSSLGDRSERLNDKSKLDRVLNILLFAIVIALLFAIYSHLN